MFSHSTDTASSFSVLAALIFSLSLAGVAWAQSNTSLGPDLSLCGLGPISTAGRK
jgi:hypothetical protein